MKFKQFIPVLALAGLAMLATAGAARALMIAPPPGAARAAQADVIVTGKVTAIEANEIQLPPFAGAPNKVAFKVAVVTIDEIIKGATGQKTVRVAFPAPVANPPPAKVFPRAVPQVEPVPPPAVPQANAIQIKPVAPAQAIQIKPVAPAQAIQIKPVAPAVAPAQAIQVQIGGFAPSTGLRGPQVAIQIAMNTEGLFFLSKTGQDGIYRATQYYDVVAKSSPTFAKDVAESKEVGKIMADPKAALQDPMREVRVQAACLLVTVYRTPRIAGQTKLVPIDAEESKLILSNLAVADWNQPVRLGGMNPQQAFYQLGVGEKEGWMQPRFAQNQQQITDAMQTWLADNAATYRIQRLVPAN